MILDDWQRIEEIVKWTGQSVNSLALAIGLNRAENLYQIKRGNNGISKDLAETITRKYPEISKAWLLTGEGNMFIGQSEKRNIIPIYDIDAVYLAKLEELPQASYLMSHPRMENIAFGALILNRAMEPQIPIGATLLFGEVKTESIMPGYPYLVVTDRITAIRTIKKVNDNEKVILSSPNAEFDDMTIDLFEITKLYLVKCHMCFNY